MFTMQDSEKLLYSGKPKLKIGYHPDSRVYSQDKKDHTQPQQESGPKAPRPKAKKNAIKGLGLSPIKKSRDP